MITARKLAETYNMLQDYIRQLDDPLCKHWIFEFYEWDDDNLLWYAGEPYEIVNWFDQSRMWMPAQFATDLMIKAMTKVANRDDRFDLDPWEFDGAIFEALREELLSEGFVCEPCKHEDDDMI